jgi:hypothetical protein
MQGISWSAEHLSASPEWFNSMDLANLFSVFQFLYLLNLCIMRSYTVSEWMNVAVYNLQLYWNVTGYTHLSITILKLPLEILPVRVLFHRIPENPASPVLNHMCPHHTPQTWCAVAPQTGITDAPVKQKQSLESLLLPKPVIGHIFTHLLTKGACMTKLGAVP